MVAKRGTKAVKRAGGVKDLPAKSAAVKGGMYDAFYKFGGEVYGEASPREVSKVPNLMLRPNRKP
jgi:hypothetical protein